MKNIIYKAKQHFKFVVKNEPLKKGQKAHKPFFFGDEYSNNRYMVYPMHTRFDDVQWMIQDADIKCDVTGGSQIIRQIDSKDEVIEEIAKLWKEKVK